MAVNLTVSETMGGAAYSDALAGGSIGIDWGQVTNGSYCPLILQSANTGYQSVWIRHDATIDPITSLRTFAQAYTGTYGGANDAATDFNTLKSEGFASSSANANNADGLYSGFVVEMDWDVTTPNQFAPSRIGSGGGAGNDVYIYGDGVGSSTDGIDLSSAFTCLSQAMVWNNAATPTAPSAPVDGSVGKSGDTALGDNCFLHYRWFLRTAASSGGILQHDVVYAYSYTA